LDIECWAFKGPLTHLSYWLRLPAMSHLRRTPSLSTRLVSGAGIALVLLLCVLASSPSAHEWVHGNCGCAANPGGSFSRLLNVLGTSPGARAWIDRHSGPVTHHHDPANPDDDGCVVTLFAHGVISATVFASLIVALSRLAAVPAQPGEEPCLSAPRYLLPPLCGPPQS
jgi:hypothetical protein